LSSLPPASFSWSPSGFPVKTLHALLLSPIRAQNCRTVPWMRWLFPRLFPQRQGSIRAQTMSGMWWTKWRLDFFPRVYRLSRVSIIPPLLWTHLLIIASNSFISNLSDDRSTASHHHQ
jgi:hypothetical protein